VALMPSILYFQQNQAFGSAERYIYDLADSMSYYGFDVHLVCPADPSMESYHSLTDRSVTIHWVDNRYYGYNSLLALLYWMRFFRELKPDIVHFNDPCLVGSVAAYLAGVPHRVMMHHTPEMHRKFNLTGRLFEFLAFRSYTRIIFSNKLSVANSMKNDGIPAEKCFVIPFGLNLDWFAPIDERAIAITRHSLNLRNSDIVILCPARLSRQKRHDLLIEAAQQVTKQVDNAIVLLAGEGELREDIAHLIESTGLSNRVRMLGHREDIRAIITASDLVVLSSDFEGFPYVLMEAAARGTPAVSTDVGGVRHSIKDGETGLIVPSGKPAQLATALLSLVIDTKKRQQFAIAARRHAEQTFTKEKMVENTAQFYRSLLIDPNTLSSKKSLV